MNTHTIAPMLLAALTMALSPASNAQPLRDHVAAEPQSVDFGDVLPGRTAERNVAITNVANFPITIRSARATCDCTIPTLSARRIEPGSSINVTVAFDASRLYGPQQPSVIIVFAEQIPPLRIEGRADVNHGIRFSDAPVPGSVRLISADAEPFRVLSVNAVPRDAGPAADANHTVSLLPAAQTPDFPGAERWAAIVTDDADAPVVVVPALDARPNTAPRSWTIDQSLRVLDPIVPGHTTTFEVGFTGLRAGTLDAFDALRITTHNAEAGLLGLETAASGTRARFYLRAHDDAQDVAAASITVEAQGASGTIDAYAGVKTPR